MIYDDISMETGRLRIRKKAVRAGITVSKILLPIWDMIYFCGLRSGSGQARETDLVDYVLGHFTKEEKEKIDRSACMAEEALCLMLQGETDAAMNRYHKTRGRR